MWGKERVEKAILTAGAAALVGGWTLKQFFFKPKAGRRTIDSRAEKLEVSHTEPVRGDLIARQLQLHIARKAGKVFIPAPAFVESVRDNPHKTAGILKTVFSQAPELDIHTPET